MSNNVIKLHDEQQLLETLIADTFNLIAFTLNISAVKKLVEIYDILFTNLNLILRYKDSLTFDEIWLDVNTLKHLNYLRTSLILCHKQDFTHPKYLKLYNRSFCNFLNLVALRLKNQFSNDD